MIELDKLTEEQSDALYESQVLDPNLLDVGDYFEEKGKDEQQEGN